MWEAIKGGVSPEFALFTYIKALYLPKYYMSELQ